MLNSVIKACGIQSISEAEAAIEAGVNTIGLLMGITHVAEDKITVERGKLIVQAVPEGIRTVMVTHLLDVEEIASIAEFTGVSAIQIHDDLPVEGLLELRKRLRGRELIKAVHVMSETAVVDAKALADYADALILDSRTKDRLGGTGLTHDWNVSRRIVESVGVPVILAGGLNPENVESAIKLVKPAGIDANSGLEHLDGSKSSKKIRQFAVAGHALLES
ncbi:phosphoribosylanthranilate isomerase [Paraburkholderia sp. GAS448]|uniref:phosphoribosylanthranilate isomerase n=1 Tax=Paraburkholderia sp. GAS448 TaxID=3035136 RepID=UPI003D23AA69